MTQRILLCDDEIAIIRAAEFKLRRAGYEVQCAGDGEEAWRLIEQSCPDLLVTDLQMPRLDGFGLCRRIRDNPRTRHLPILMLTAKGFEISSAAASEEHGVLAVMAKPFSPRELLMLVEQALESRAELDQLVADPPRRTSVGTDASSVRRAGVGPADVRAAATNS